MQYNNNLCARKLFSDDICTVGRRMMGERQKDGGRGHICAKSTLIGVAVICACFGRYVTKKSSLQYSYS